eukprot:6174137-Pleurochrysis_carterae.AAC.3
MRTRDFNLLGKLLLPIRRKRIPASESRHPDRPSPNAASKMTELRRKDEMEIGAGMKCWVGTFEYSTCHARRRERVSTPVVWLNLYA